MAWRKMFRGVTYQISTRQLQEQGHEVLSHTKEGSRIAANAWWRQKELEIEAASRPPRRPLLPAEDVYAAATGQSLERVADYSEPVELFEGGPGVDPHAEPVGYTPNLPDPNLIRQVVAGVLARYMVGGEPLPELFHQILPPARVKQLEDGIKALRGGPAVEPDKTVAAWADTWLKVQRLREAAKEISLGGMDNKRRWVARFVEFVGPEADVAVINDPLLDAWDDHCLGRRAAKENGEEGGWGDYLCRDIRRNAKEFVGWLADQGAIPRPAYLTRKGRKFRLAPREPKPWTVEQFKAGLAGSTDKARLILLLMANCGFNQKDASDLKDAEVDWEGGYVTRRRSKERHLKSAPVVRYKLWPTTLALLKKHRSGQERVLVTDRNNPYVRERWKNGKRVRVDSFNSYYRLLRRRIAKAVPGFNGTPKGVRNMSATQLEEHPIHSRYVGHFLCHAPSTTARRFYTRQSQDQFDEAVAWLGRRLGQVE
jgi:integrase